MGKGNQGSANRAATVAKAGKRSGQAIWPAPASSERIAAREQGEQQFVAKKQLTVEREVTKIEYDKALKGFVERTRKITSSAEYLYDPNRGRVVYNPFFKEKASK